MRDHTTRAVTLALAAATIGALAPAQAPTAEFAAPVRLKAGAKFLGEGRLYPSPVFHDVNGDGLLDIVVGDLIGKLTFALRQPGAGAPVYAAEQAMKAADGSDLKFHNW